MSEQTVVAPESTRKRKASVGHVVHVECQKDHAFYVTMCRIAVEPGEHDTNFTGPECADCARISRCPLCDDERKKS